MKELDKDILAQIIAYRRKGTKVSAICKLLGISRITYDSWINKGKSTFEQLADESLDISELNLYQKACLSFYIESEKALAEFEEEQLNTLRKSRAWQAKAWLLERLDAESWNKPNESHVTVNTEESAKNKFNAIFDKVLQED